MEKSREYFVTSEGVLIFNTNYKAMETVFEVYGVESIVRVNDRYEETTLFGGIQLLSTFGVQKRVRLTYKYSFVKIAGCIRIFER